MLFNSTEFVVFILVFYNFYLHLQKSRKGQNALLLVGSYIFYGWWDWRFLSLLALSTVIDYTIGRKMEASEEDGRRKRLMLVSVFSNLSILGFFKYFNFFVDSFVEMANRVGWHVDSITLGIILPVGISFYTFQTLSYSIDIYRGKLKATDSLLDFAVFVSFFPQLVAGPIERASNFLPQISKPRVLSAAQVEAGLFLVMWGAFKKIVIADNMALVANEIFNHHESFYGLDLVLAALAFTVQIYCDFSGYSDMARGLAKIMGFELMVNFKLPYFSRSPSEFWQRWHISLSSWLRDYLYISLGGNRSGTWMTYRNLSLTMLLGGLWHGAAWNFVIWGAYQGGILVLYRVFEPKSRQLVFEKAPLEWTRKFAAWALMFVFTVIGWIIFRAESASQIFYFLTEMGFATSGKTSGFAHKLIFFSTPLIVIQLIQYFRHDLLAPLRMPWPMKALFVGVLGCAICMLGVRESIEFIYFQF